MKSSPETEQKRDKTTSEILTWRSEGEFHRPRYTRIVPVDIVKETPAATKMEAQKPLQTRR